MMFENNRWLKNKHIQNNKGKQMVSNNTEIGYGIEHWLIGISQSVPRKHLYPSQHILDCSLSRFGPWFHAVDATLWPGPLQPQLKSWFIT